jgi:hypothetical protein
MLPEKRLGVNLRPVPSPGFALRHVGECCVMCHNCSERTLLLLNMVHMRRSRTSIWKPLLTVLALGTTLPMLALFCRGHSPSRYDAANLPAWEREAPSPARALAVFRAVPVAVDLKPAVVPIYAELADADENRMFRNLEVQHNLPLDRLSAGEPGAWLEAVAVLSPSGGDLRSKMDRVANRLMSCQDSDGYLGAAQPVHRYTARDIAAHANNLRGLLAYYRLTRRTASVYAAMRAGDFLLQNYDPSPGREEAGAEDSLVFALANLYQATGEIQYLRFAQREEARRGCDGLGLCALYEATGVREYLKAAVRTWSEQQAGVYAPSYDAVATPPSASDPTDASGRRSGPDVALTHSGQVLSSLSASQGRLPASSTRGGWLGHVAPGHTSPQFSAEMFMLSGRAFGRSELRTRESKTVCR